MSRPTVDMLDEAPCLDFAADVGAFLDGAGARVSDLGGVGLAIPGIAVEGAYSTPNVRVDWPFLIHCLEDALGKADVAVANDANVAALGELWMGAGEGVRSLLLATVGSGLGSGLVVDARIVPGAHGAAGELGHVTVVPQGRPCNCGRAGCAER